MIRENLEQVEANIRMACRRSGRSPEDVTLIAVSKTKPVEMIDEAYACGKREFGENKAQELRDKFSALPEDIKWHFIGHLQTNKVKYVVGKASLIHSVDSVHLAEALETESSRQNVITRILAQVNVAEENTKFGATLEEAAALVAELASFPHLRVEGLMTIAPFVENSEENRPIFRKLKQLSVDIGRKNIDNVSMGILSMGMTNDYEVAIEEGATHVRVGTGIFGARDYGRNGD